jgi:hypothetical protein
MMLGTVLLMTTMVPVAEELHTIHHHHHQLRNGTPSRALLAPSFVGKDWSKLQVKEVPIPTITRPTGQLSPLLGIAHCPSSTST